MAALLSIACGDSEPADGGGGAGGGGAASTSSSKSASSSSSTASSSSSSSPASSSATSSSSSGMGGGWPTCDTQPPGSQDKTLAEIWVDDPAAPTEVWVPGVYVTAVSGSACSAGTSCQIFVQQQESYPTLAAAAHQSIRVAVVPDAAEHFEGIAVGDRIDLFASAFRDTSDGRNELIFLVSPNLPGCAAVVGTGDPQPVTVTLDQLTLAAYETDIGPVLVRVETVSGNPALPDETFGLWDTGGMIGGDITTVTSLSPFFLPGGMFTGLTQGMITDFAEVVGVFAIYAPDADPLIKYEEIYVRSDAEYPAL